MQTLKILLLSLLTIFLLPAQSIFAQTIQTTEDKIFTKFLCKDDIAHPYCLFTNINLPLGYDDYNMSQEQIKTMLDNTCKFLTWNDQAKNKSYKLGSSADIMQVEDNYIAKRGRGPVYTEIICTIPKEVPKIVETETEITYNNPICSDTKTCNTSYSSNFLGFVSNQNETQKQNSLNYFCQKATENEQSTAIRNTISTDTVNKIFFLFFHTTQNRVTYGTNNNPNKYYTSVTCSKPQTLPPPPPKIPGCTNSSALNYNPDATEDNGTCIEKIEGCTDSTAINYNPQANVHKESMCEYPPTHTPQDITGAFEKSQVSIGATTWTVRFNLNVTGAILDPSTIQTWDKFTAVDSITNDKTITITLRQFDDQRLDVECTNYEVTIPRRALITTQGDTNPNPISGNFEVIGCQNSNTDPQDPNTQNQDEEMKKFENTIKESNFYLSLYDTDEKGKVYINLTNLIYILGFISFFLVLFFVLFGFIKNSFLGKQKR